ncbi:aminotransferase class I/II-fold pyridoxal phosphate-dependent enzyme [Pseudoponticoccus marisrubri]|uniref:aspartate transaminase n=1 Tax=Pseudoponticoccus marisrubri TaxID=1685382 RepID=A0A0W7WH82_9RHOB|nr:aminotransferase class I/II-fold pyridoxal phosphate-dependent enzyme [Pseudoponticoccus marisrubri]KUF09949.1 aspartate aminotransferase [Pseudoponticoccus marisrubri]
MDTYRHSPKARSARVAALELPERADIAPPSVREADLAILAAAPEGYLDTTHFDTAHFPPPDWALERFAAAARDGALAYTGYSGHAGVLRAVASNVSSFLGVPVEADRNIALTPGTQAALFCVLAARVDPGDRVVVMDPDYLFTARIFRFLGAEVAYAPLILQDGKYVPDLDLIETEFRDRGATQLVFSHPNNPTGAVYGPEIIRALARLAVRYGVGIVADELYSRLIHDDTPFAHIAAEEGAFELTATLLGPSKTESLSGYRLGVVVGPETLLRGVENVLSVTALRAPAYAQHLLPGWLGPDANWLRDRLAQFSALRRQTIARLSGLDWMTLHPQDGTAYLWADVRALGRSDLEIGTALAREAGMLISPGYQFGPGSAGHFRICYAREPRGWATAMDRMVDVLDGMRLRPGP